MMTLQRQVSMECQMPKNVKLIIMTDSNIYHLENVKSSLVIIKIFHSEGCNHHALLLHF